MSARAANNLAEVRAELRRGSGVVVLPAGETRLTAPLLISGAKQLTIRGNTAGSSLKLERGFSGKAAIVAEHAAGLTLEGFSIVGDRVELRSAWGLPLKEAAFADYYPANGIVVAGSKGVTVRSLRFSQVRAFPVLVSASEEVHVGGVHIEDCGTLNPEGKNNTTGGILLEEGVQRFEVRDSTIQRITGNGIWTHSYARSPRAADGVIAGNTIEGSARDAIQVGHATRVRVENNRGSKIGFPSDQIDFAGFGTPVAVDTAGNVDSSVYTGNSFTDVGGQCIDLDGFHDGEVTNNTCVNSRPLENYPGLHFGILFGNHDPGMTSRNVRVTGNTLDGFAYGAVFLIGTGHRVENNRFLNVNMAQCGSTPKPARCNYAPEQPDMLLSGIYLGNDGGRPSETTGNIIRGNRVRGAAKCVAAAPGVPLRRNTVESNVCER
jgi:hypothetical protein